jgi:hypothetical protein
MYAEGWDLLGLALILLALYLQDRVERENIWHGKSAVERFFGRAERRNVKSSEKRP